MIRSFVMMAGLVAGLPVLAATNMARYYGHDAVVDEHGVISPWYQGLNGQCDYRVRIGRNRSSATRQWAIRER